MVIEVSVGRPTSSLPVKVTSCRIGADCAGTAALLTLNTNTANSAKMVGTELTRLWFISSPSSKCL